MADPDPRGHRTMVVLRIFSAFVTACYLVGGLGFVIVMVIISGELNQVHMNHGYVLTMSMFMGIQVGACYLLLSWTFRGPPITMYIYGCVLACLFVVTLTSCLTVAIFRDTIRKDMESGYNMTLITSDPPNKNMLFVQKQLKCCGVNNYTDWVLLSPKHIIPTSCCIYDKPCVTSNYNDVHQQGCYQKIAEFISKHLMRIVAGACVVSLLPAVGSILTCYLGHQMEMKLKRWRGSDTFMLT